MIGRFATSFTALAMIALFAAASARAQGASESIPSPAQGALSGSVPARPEQGTIQISLQDAIQRGLRQNLGLLLANQDTRAAHGERWKALSALLPNVTTTSYVQGSKVDLAEFGFTFKLPPSAGFSLPSVVGPFGYFDSRAYLTQSIFDWKAINSSRAASQSEKSAQYTYKDTRDLVVLAVGYTYLRVIADSARIDTADAQVKSAQAVYDQASDQVKAGTSPAIDALRAQVELKSRQQGLIQAKNDFAIDKLTLARVIGLAPGQEFDLTEKSPYEAFPGLTVDEALKRAYASRSDYQAALADVRAAEYEKKAAEGGFFPSLSFSTDYGLAGTEQGLDTHGVFDVKGSLTIPIFQGGRVHGDIIEANARLQQSRDRLDNLRAQIDQDVRTALLNLESAEEQVQVAQSNIDLADQTLAQSQDRFKAGVTDTVEVVQAEEAVASAHESYISSLYSDNYAKISLARALGAAEEGVKEYFKGK